MTECSLRNLYDFLNFVHIYFLNRWICCKGFWHSFWLLTKLFNFLFPSCILNWFLKIEVVSPFGDTNVKFVRERETEIGLEKIELAKRSNNLKSLQLDNVKLCRCVAIEMCLSMYLSRILDYLKEFQLIVVNIILLLYMSYINGKQKKFE